MFKATPDALADGHAVEIKTTSGKNNLEDFREKLTAAYADLFRDDPGFRIVAANTTPEQLAEKMLTGALAGKANHDGPGFKRACKALGIKATLKAIREYCGA